MSAVSPLRVSQKLFHCLSFASAATLLNTSVFSSMCALIIRETTMKKSCEYGEYG